MKTLRSILLPIAAFFFSAAAHAAPVQYQLTAYHTSESSAAGDTLLNPVNSSDYFFADGTSITATFYYDSAAVPASTNQPLTFYGPSGTYTALSSRYSAFSNLTLQIAGQSIQATGMTVYSGGPTPPVLIPNTVVADSDNSSDASRDWIQGIFLDKNFTELSFGDYRASTAVIILGGYNDMLSNQSLPNTLNELNPYIKGMAIVFNNSTTRRSILFSEGSISQVPLPNSALLFLSGLVGLGANTARKLKR